MARGWISMHRQIQTHWLWEDKPFSKGQAWIDLLLMANHEDARFLLGNQLIESKTGDVVTSEVKLMERWGWSKSKVRAFLSLLENDSMIIKKADNKKTTLNIVNYGLWQDSQTAKRPQKDRKETAKKLRKDTINNLNNLNNNINIASVKAESDDVEKVFEFYCETLGVKRTLTKTRRTKIAARLKEFSVDELKQTIINMEADDFVTGNNPGGKFYAEIEYLCRSQEKVEKYLNPAPIKSKDEHQPSKEPPPRKITDDEIAMNQFARELGVVT